MSTPDPSVLCIGHFSGCCAEEDDIEGLQDETVEEENEEGEEKKKRRKRKKQKREKIKEAKKVKEKKMKHVMMFL